MMMKKRCGVIKDYQDWIKPKIVENALELLDKEIPKLKHKIEDNLDVLKLININIKNDQYRITPETDAIVTIKYEAVFKDSKTNIIGKKGVILRGTWYPLVEGMFVYSLKAALPDGHRRR